ncbi:hypothetical protein KI387_040857, partial [Taxus chinensis]
MNKKPIKKHGSTFPHGWGDVDPDLVEVATFKESYNSSTEKKAVESMRMDTIPEHQGTTVVSGTKWGHSPMKLDSEQEWNPYWKI